MLYRAFISYSQATDQKFALSLRSGLQRFAKPWYRLRAIRVFCDKTSLSPNPKLWSTIEKALINSEFFILLASPSAATSKWVQREITTWLNHNVVDKFLIVLTDGKIIWDNSYGDFDWHKTTGLPKSLKGIFEEEPLYVDLRHIKPHKDLSIRDSELRNSIAELASSLHGKPKDLLVGEDVRQHRKSIRLAWLVSISLFVLTIFTVIAAYLAFAQQRIAVNERQIALSLQLAAQSELALRSQSGLELGALLAIEAIRKYPSIEAIEALRDGLKLLPRPLHNFAHAGKVTGIRFTSDGQFLISSSEDSSTNIWTISNGNLFKTIKHKSMVKAIDLSSDGRLLTTACDNGNVSIWEISSGKRLTQLAHNGDINDVEISPDCKQIVTASSDSTARIWEIVNGVETVEMKHDSEVISCTYSSKGNFLATTTKSDRLSLWDAHNGKALGHATHDHRAGKIAISPNETHLVAVYGRTATVFDVGSGQVISSFDHQDVIQMVKFSPDGRYLASGSGQHWYPSSDLSARIWDAKTGKEVLRMSHDWSVGAVAFSPDGQYLCSASSPVAILWRAKKGWTLEEGSFASPDFIYGAYETARFVHDWDLGGVQFDPMSQYVGTASDSSARIWSSQFGEELHRVSLNTTLRCLDLDPDGKSIISAGDDGKLTRIDITNGHKTLLLENQDQIIDIAISRNGAYLFTASNSGPIRMWDLSSGNEIDQVDVKSDVIDVSADGEYLAARTHNSDHILVWKLDGWSEVAHLKHNSNIEDIVFSPDGSYLVTASSEYGIARSDDNIAIVWDVSNWQEIRRLSHMEEIDMNPLSIRSIAFSSDSRYLVTAGGGVLSIWETDTWKLHKRIRHASTNNVTISPDGQYLATAGHKTQVWEISSGAKVSQISYESHKVKFISSRRYLATISFDGTVRIWNIWPEDLITEACNRLTRNMTAEEWSQYLGEEPYSMTCECL